MYHVKTSKYAHLIIFIVILGLLMGCSRQPNVSSKITSESKQPASHSTIPSSSHEQSSTMLPVPDVESSILSESEKEILRTQAIDFAINFPYPFSSTNDISYTAVGWYTFWKLYEKNPEMEDGERYYLLSKDNVDQYLQTYFGISELVWLEDLPRYDVNEMLYYFIPVGESPLIEAEIIEENFFNNKSVVITFELYHSAMGSDAPPREFIMELQYSFDIIYPNNSSNIGLKLISAT